jgi:hypothetical protein
MQRSREQWAKIVEQFEHNGETHEAFCARLHLPVWSFRSWLYRLRRESSQGKVAHSATRLLPVRLGSSDVGQDETVVEVVVGDTVIRLRGMVAPAYVAELLAQLRTRC